MEWRRIQSGCKSAFCLTDVNISQHLMNAMSTSKYLDQDGLQYFWGKIKDHVDSKLSNVKAYVEVEPKSHTETTEEHVEYEGTIVPLSSDDFIGICFGYETENEGKTEYGTSDEIWLTPNNAAPAPENSTFLSNTEYTFDFTLDSSIQYSAIAVFMVCAVSDKNKSVTQCQYGIFPQNSQFPNLEYEGWEGSNDEFAPFIKMTLPAIGSESQFRFNFVYNIDDNVDKEIPENEQDMSIVLSNVDGTNYQLKFYWDYSEDVSTTETTSWKELKTTLELNEEESVVINKPISGLLQDARLGKRSEYVIENVTSEGQYMCGIILNDETFDPTTIEEES